MLNNFDALRIRFQELNDKLLSQDLGSERKALQKEHSYISSILSKYDEILSIDKKIEDSKAELQKASDEEFKLMFQEEIQQLEDQKKQLERELEDLLFPPDELDSSSAYIEMRAGAGGQEAAPARISIYADEES